MHLEQIALIVDDYDAAIDFYVGKLGFELVEDSAALTNDGRPKRWVVVRPPGAATGLLLARADGDDQQAAVGNQFAGRVGLFLRVDDFREAYGRMRAAGVEFVSEPRDEPYGSVAIFVDVAGNRWDLLGPRPGAASGALTATVLRSWDAWEQRDMDTVVASFTPDVVHDLSHYEGWPREATNAGIGPALDSLAAWMAWWRGYTQELVDSDEAPGRVLLHLRHRGERDGRAIDERLALLFYLDNTNRITRWEPWSDPEAATRALHA